MDHRHSVLCVFFTSRLSPRCEASLLYLSAMLLGFSALNATSIAWSHLCLALPFFSVHGQYIQSLEEG